MRHQAKMTTKELLVASLHLVAMPFVTSTVLVASSYLLLVVVPLVTSVDVLVPSKDEGEQRPTPTYLCFSMLCVQTLHAPRLGLPRPT